MVFGHGIWAGKFGEHDSNYWRLKVCGGDTHVICVLLSFAQAAGEPCCAPPLHTHTTAQAEVLEARLRMQQCISRHFPIRHDSRWRAEKETEGATLAVECVCQFDQTCPNMILRILDFSDRGS